MMTYSEIDLKLDSSSGDDQSAINSTQQLLKHSTRSEQDWSKIGQVSRTSVSNDMAYGELNHDWL
jgi:hypothetical protein